MLDSVCVNCESFKVPNGKFCRGNNVMSPESKRHVPPNTDTIQTKPFPIRGELLKYKNVVCYVMLLRADSFIHYSYYYHLDNLHYTIMAWKGFQMK